jgi:hypothetical protein
MKQHKILRLFMPFLVNIVFGILLLAVYFISRAVQQPGLWSFFNGFFIAVQIVNMLGVPIYYEVIWHAQPKTVRRSMVPAEIAVICNFVYFILIFWIFNHTYSWIESVAALLVPIIYEVISYWVHRIRYGKPEVVVQKPAKPANKK